MTLLDLSQDLLPVDGTEQVTLRQAGISTGETISGALRRAVRVVEREQSGGEYQAHDLKWIIPAKGLVSAPQPGWILEDGLGVTWTILEVSLDGLGSRYALRCRNLVIEERLDLVIVVEQSTTRLSASGDAIVTWEVVHAGIRARIAPIDSQVMHDQDRRFLRGTHVVYLAEEIPLDTSHRFRSGTHVYRVLSVAGRERIGELVSVRVEESS